MSFGEATKSGSQERAQLTAAGQRWMYVRIVRSAAFIQERGSLTERGGV